MSISKSYFPGIDVIKGCLILQVVLTHSLGGNNFSFLMYSYHMPLFLSISGFLIKQDRLRKLSFGDLVRKYLYRLIIPWIIAFLFYNTIVYFDDIINFRFDIIAVLKAIVYPYYHLWFIPALLFMIFCLWVIERNGIKPKYVLAFALCITLSWFGYFSWEDQRLMESNWLYVWIGDKRNFIYFFFFFLSYYLKNYGQHLLRRINKKLLWFLIPAFTFLLVLSTYMGSMAIRPYYYTLCYMLFNLSIIYFSLSYLINIKFKSSIFQFSNNYSMVIYLYHYIILEEIIRSMDPYFGESLLRSGLIFLVTCLILLPLIKLLSGIRFIDLYVFGNTKRMAEKKDKAHETFGLMEPARSNE
ncbi:acyltransferase [Fulvivirgaceae bacterium BMA10]|uniref:Acyltransferase n=1 Tax=Splendidivirga corallicola TaxID=3051826 RepID=A0ABT8KIW8_9BACT|nr:acyltransferase [Fulvivirgaceae bacterium BMA10]